MKPINVIKHLKESEYNVNEMTDEELYELYYEIIDDIETGQWSSVHTLLPAIEEEMEKRGIEPINEDSPFESKRVPEDQIREKGYQYFSTHGIGPGTHPKDVKVRELDIDLPGGWVTFKTDRPLTSEELSKYDIQPETKNSYYRKRFGLTEESIKDIAKQSINGTKLYDLDGNYLDDRLEDIGYTFRFKINGNLYFQRDPEHFDDDVIKVEGDYTYAEKFDHNGESLLWNDDELHALLNK